MAERKQKMTIKFEAELVEAVQFEVEMPESIAQYAESFLIIVNNAREYPREFYKVENNSKNSVYVTCPIESKESVKDFLEWRGKIVAEHKVLVCKPEYVWNRQTSEYLDKIFEDDNAPHEIITLAPDLYEVY